MSFYWEVSYFWSTIMVSIGIYTLLSLVPDAATYSSNLLHRRRAVALLSNLSRQLSVGFRLWPGNKRYL